MRKLILAAALLAAGIASVPATARTMMEYGSMPMRAPQAEQQQTQPQEAVGAGEAQLRSVQESARQGRTSALEPGLHDDNDSESLLAEAERTGMRSFYWLLGLLSLAALLALAYTLAQRRRVPDFIRR